MDPKSKRWIDSAVFLFCVAGCAYQLYSFSKIYFGYPVLTVLKISHPKNLTIPDLSFCFPFFEAIYFPDYDKLYPNEIAEVFNRTRSKFPDYSPYHILALLFSRNHSAELHAIKHYFKFDVTLDHMSPAFYDGDVLINKVRILNQSSNELVKGDFLTDLKIAKSLRNKDDICYTVHFTRTDLVYDYTKIGYNVHSKILAVVEIDLTGIPFHVMEFFFHKQGTKPRGYGMVPLEFHRITPGHHYLTYDFISFSRLKAPYTTDCRDYPESRQAVLDACAMTLAEKEMKSVCCGAVAPTNLSITPYAQKSIAEFNKIQRSIMTRCHKMHPQPDCEFSILYGKVDSYEPRNSDDDPNDIWIRAPKNEGFVTTVEESVSQLTFLLSIGGTLAQWFGFTLLHFSMFSTKTAQNVIDRLLGRKVGNVIIIHNRTIDREIDVPARRRSRACREEWVSHMTDIHNRMIRDDGNMNVKIDSFRYGAIAVSHSGKKQTRIS